MLLQPHFNDNPPAQTPSKIHSHFKLPPSKQIPGLLIDRYDDRLSPLNAVPGQGGEVYVGPLMGKTTQSVQGQQNFVQDPQAGSETSPFSWPILASIVKLCSILLNTTSRGEQ
jgi:hypothetical protein